MAAMAILRTILCAVFMVTVVLSKPVFLSEVEDSSKSSESSESNSSEETGAHVGASEEPVQQPALTETDLPNAMEETDPLGTAALLPSADAAGPSPATLDTSALPEDPQSSTDADASHLMPDDPSQTALGIDISQDMPDSDPALDPINAETEHVLPDAEVSLNPGLTQTDTITGNDGTDQPQVTTTTITYQVFPQGTTPPFPPHIIKPTSPSSSTASPLPINTRTAVTGVPVCFTFQFTTSAPEPPRGDSI